MPPKLNNTKVGINIGCAGHIVINKAELPEPVHEEADS
jgi:hypothetical protein